MRVKERKIGNNIFVDMNIELERKTERGKE